MKKFDKYDVSEYMSFPNKEMLILGVGMDYCHIAIEYNNVSGKIKLITRSEQKANDLISVLSIVKNNIENYNSLILPEYDLKYYDLLSHAKGSSEVIFEEQEHGEKYHFPDPFKFELHPYSFKADDSWIMDMKMASKTKWRVV